MVAVTDLAEGLRPIGEHLGIDAAMTVAREFGGTRLWVPKSWRVGHELGAVGDALAQELVAHFGGEHLDIPLHALSEEARHRIARQMVGDGANLNAVARQLCMTRSGVIKMLRNGPRQARGRAADGRQMSLLDRL